jgi:hypothetical protein
LATQQLDRRFRDGTTPRTRYIEQVGHLRAPIFMSSSIGASVIVVTTDGKVLVCQRGENVGSRPGFWGVSADEGFSPSIDGAGRGSPRLYEVARRGMREELFVEDHEYRLALLAFTIDTERHQWDSIFIAYLHDLDERGLVSRLTRGAPDRWERQDHKFITFNPRTIISSLTSTDSPLRWTPVAPVALYLALVHEFGYRRVEQAIGKFARARP